jgi:hypothetical protein
MDVKFGFTYENWLVATTAHEMVAVVKAEADSANAHRAGAGRALI